MPESGRARPRPMCYRRAMRQAPPSSGRGPAHRPGRIPRALLRPCLAGLLALAAGTAAGADAPAPSTGPAIAAPRHRGTHDGPVTPRPGLTVPSLHLEDQFGRPFTQTRLRGRWTLLFLGYTHCPDYCPATLLTLDRAARELGRRDPALAERLQVVFVSVDPFRDTRGALADYIAHFNPTFLAATGAPADLKRLALQLGANYRYTDTASGRAIHDVRRRPAGDYAVNHDAGLFVFDARAHFFERLDPPLDGARVEALLARIQKRAGGD